MQAVSAIQFTAPKNVIEALEIIGGKIEEVVAGTGILFTYGGVYYVASPSEDQSYLCVVFPKFSDMSGFPSLAAANEAIHEINARMKLARVWIDHGQLHASSETILDPGMQLDRVLNRLLKTLQAIVLEARVRERMPHAQDKHLEPDNLIDQISERTVAIH